ncbi:crossover junction endodeoxyribonuclease RuvC [Methanocella arvoryzae]|uniref:Holliday junction resolvasome, endonuclease subunit n=1 Tax=Methanocella arvoryzae (strain DSM 22066 / NBRC 105507 / MRE50) TaxID=351160 RepID=Q0W1R8_METAR|nr:crossover junction endodeoxyribonuclease RuvC [Methanocella arvoryzae]CAJ37675.1 holliday junction resolvasome, endonuclease subunit [Methanocella arvoryzae MRE50]
MRILGIDPGFALVGFGIVEAGKNGLKAGKYGHISTESGLPVPDRLKILYDDMSTVIAEYKPDVVAVEELFFNKNVKTAIVASHARGVLVLAAVNAGLEVAEYTPLQVKQAVVGYGRATKQQVQLMVTRLLALKEVPKPDDTADALAVAICHANSAKMENIGHDSTYRRQNRR